MKSVDPQILAMIDEVDRLKATRTDHWQIPRAEGELLHHIALCARARLIVEVGTSYGFSSLFWGAALKRTGGHLHTIDINPNKYESARHTFQRAGLHGIITGYLGDARQVLPAIPAPIDIAFIDADKESCTTYFDLIWPNIRVGGMVLTDNATTHRKELADFVAMVRARDDASSTEIAIGNGLEWTIKVK